MNDPDETYRRASRHGDEGPGEAVRRAVLDHAARLAAQHARTQADVDARRVGGHRPWRAAAWGTVAAAVLAGVLIAPHFLQPLLPAAAPPQAADQSRVKAAPAAALGRGAPSRETAAGETADSRETAALQDAPHQGTASRVRAQRPPTVVSEQGVATSGAAPSAPGAAGPQADRVDLNAPVATERRTAAMNEARAASAAAAVQSPGDGGALLRAAAVRGDVAQLTTLLQASTDVDARDAQGRTALILAAGAGQGEAAMLLLEHGADPNAMDRTGATALQTAAAADQRELVTLLRRHGGR